MKNAYKNKVFFQYALGMAMVFLLGAGGCRSTSICVLDAETKMPIPCATVDVLNQDFVSMWSRKQSHETDKEGEARVLITGLLRISVQKKDYKNVVFMMKGKRYLTPVTPETVFKTTDGVTVYLPRNAP